MLLSVSWSARVVHDEESLLKITQLGQMRARLWPSIDSFSQRLEGEAHAFVEDFATELGFAGLALRENDGEFAEGGAAAVEGELHLHEEGVALGVDFVEVDSAQDRHFASLLRALGTTAGRE